MQIFSDTDLPDAAKILRKATNWPAESNMAFTGIADYKQVRQLTGHMDSTFGDRQTLVVINNQPYLVFDPGCFFSLVNNEAWWEGQEVQLPREERMFLLSQLSGTVSYTHLTLPTKA